MNKFKRCKKQKKAGFGKGMVSFVKALSTHPNSVLAVDSVTGEIVAKSNKVNKNFEKLARSSRNPVIIGKKPSRFYGLISLSS